jgi:hypothetical protein
MSVTAMRTNLGPNLAFFEENVPEEDLLDFLTEWSDSITQNDNLSHYKTNGSTKRKVDETFVDSNFSRQGPFDPNLLKLPVQIGTYLHMYLFIYIYSYIYIYVYTYIYLDRYIYM